MIIPPHSQEITLPLIIVYILVGVLIVLISDRHRSTYDGLDAILMCILWPFVLIGWMFEFLMDLNQG